MFALFRIAWRFRPVMLSRLRVWRPKSAPNLLVSAIVFPMRNCVFQQRFQGMPHIVDRDEVKTFHPPFERTAVVRVPEASEPA